MVVGTKVDCRTDEECLRSLSEEGLKPVTAEEGDKMAKQIKAVCYMECSAYTNTGLNQVFNEAIHIVTSGPGKNHSGKHCIIL